MRFVNFTNDLIARQLGVVVPGVFTFGVTRFRNATFTGRGLDRRRLIFTFHTPRWLVVVAFGSEVR